MLTKHIEDTTKNIAQEIIDLFFLKGAKVSKKDYDFVVEKLNVLLLQQTEIFREMIWATSSLQDSDSFREALLASLPTEEKP